MRRLWGILRDAWRLSRPYFASEEKFGAWVLLITIIAMNLFLVGMDVILNFWNGAFYDSLQNKDFATFIQLLLWGKYSNGIMPGFCLIAAVYIVVAVYRTYLNQWLQINWRNWLTRHFMDRWLGDRVYYRISLNQGHDITGTDNPDQRISDDLRDFTSSTLALGLDLMSNVVELISFIGILWALSGPMHLFGIGIPGYLVWVALIYALVGTWLTHLVGRPLAFLRFQQQRVEADFRFALARLRENTEAIALYGGEAQEHAGLAARFRAVVELWWRIMTRVKYLNALTAGYNQVATVFPIVVAAPRYFSGAIALGGLTRISSAFGQVQGSMSWFVNSYADIASWFATVERLSTFHRAIDAARQAAGTGPHLAASEGKALSLDQLTLTLPDGKVLTNAAALSIAPGEHLLVTGRSGSGKSTLFRAMAGIWPFGSGTVQRPAGTYLFLPQRPYFPLGSLRNAILYPGLPTDLDDAAIEATLRRVGLGNLLGRLDEEQNWIQALSGGEQQRLAIARALLVKPDWLFLDEATASLDQEAEQAMYQLLREDLPNATIVSIAHNTAVAPFHDHRVVFARDSDAPGTLRDAPLPNAAQ
jgi:vitamin B12/bleomycin/antimicrobial peptide transport system ATP-binding/permease protein